jgi:hypothetical protein
MADAKIVISAEDRASAVLRGVRGSVESSVAAFSRLGGVIGAIGVGGAVAAFQQMVGALDDLSEAAEGVGVSAVALAELRQAAAFAGVDAGKLDKALSGLATRLDDAAKGGEQSAAIFNALGIAIKNNDGTLRSTDAVLADVADSLAKYRDGTEKTALANQLFGEKLGRVLIPYLNQGGDALRQFAGVTEKSVEDARKLQDQIDKLSASWQRLKFSVAGAIASLFNEDTKSAEALSKTLADLDRQIDRARAARGREREPERIAAYDVALEGLEDQARRTREALERLNRPTAEARPAAPIIPEIKSRAAAGGKPPAEVISDAQRALAQYVAGLQRESDALEEITEQEKVLQLLRANPEIDTAQVRELLFAEVERVEAARQRKAIEEEVRRINEQQAAEVERLRDTVLDLAGVGEEERKRKLAEQLEILIQQGRVTQEQALRAVNAIAGTTKEIEKARDAADEFALVFTSSLGKLIEGGGGGIRGFFEALAQDILKLVTRLLILEPIAARLKEIFKDFGSGGGGGSLVDSFASFLGSAFGGARAMGGPVSAGRAYLVGERGPELFMPGSSGRVIANGAGGAVININMPAGSNVDRSTASQIGAAVARQLSVANRRYN